MLIKLLRFLWDASFPMFRLSRENMLHLRKLWQILFWGNSYSFLINFALYTHLYFHTAFLRMCVFIWAPQKRRPRQDSWVRGLLKKCSEENISENGSGESRVGQRKELSKVEASAWSHRDCGGWVKYPRDVRTLLSGNIFFFAPLSVSHTLWCGREMGRVYCNSQAKRI